MLGQEFHRKGLGVPTQKVNLLSGVAQALIYPNSFSYFANVKLFVHPFTFAFNHKS